MKWKFDVTLKSLYNGTEGVENLSHYNEILIQERERDFNKKTFSISQLLHVLNQNLKYCVY